MIQYKKNEAGFTLIELMIVVAIIGVLAALAIYGVSQYLRHSKTAEAPTNLSIINTGAQSKYNVDTTAADGSTVNEFCATPKVAAIPALWAKGSTGKTAIAATDLAADASPDQGWMCLKFQLAGSVYYQYAYVSNGVASPATAAAAATGAGAAAKFEASATGDLNGDGNTAVFASAGYVTNGAVSIAGPQFVAKGATTIGAYIISLGTTVSTGASEDD